MALPGDKPPGQAALEKKQVTWNCTPPQSQLSSTRVLVEATPSEYGCGGMNEEDADDSYMADLLAASQPAESPMTGNQLKASQYHNQEGSFGESSPLPLDTSLDLSASHIAPLSSQTQAAQNSLERNIPIGFANYTRIDMNSSDRSMFGSLVHPARSLGTSNSEDPHERLNHRTGQPLTSDTSRAPEFQQTSTPEARKIAQEASTASGLAKDILSSQCSLVCGSSPAQLEISMEMGEPMHIHSTGVMQSTIPPHPPSQSNLATLHVSEVSSFLAVDNAEDDIDRANAIDRPLQSTCPKNASLARPDSTRRLALAASGSDDSLADSSSDGILSRSNIDFSLNNTPNQPARAHLDTNELSHLSPRTDQLLYSPALKSILNSPGSPTRSYRSPPRSLQPLSSTLDLLDPPHLANKILTERPACSKSSKLELVSSEVQNEDEENDASVDLRFQGFHRRTRSSNSTQQFQGLQDSNSRINLNQDQTSEATRYHNTPQDDFRGDEETQENGSLSALATQINEPLPPSRNSLPTRSAASLPRRNIELPHNQLETFTTATRPNLNLQPATSSDSGSYEAPPKLIYQPLTALKARDPATFSDSSSYEAQPTQINQPLTAIKAPEKRTATFSDSSSYEVLPTQINQPLRGSRGTGIGVAGRPMHNQASTPPSRRAQDSHPSETGRSTNNVTRERVSRRSRSSDPDMDAIAGPYSRGRDLPASRYSNDPISASDPAIGHPTTTHKRKRTEDETEDDFSDVRAPDSDAIEMPIEEDSSSSVLPPNAGLIVNRLFVNDLESNNDPIPMNPSTSTRSPKKKTTTTTTTKSRISAKRSTVPKSPIVSRAAKAVASDIVFPIKRVLGYWQQSQAFSPGVVQSVTPDQVNVQHDDGPEAAYSVESLRRCEIVRGDVVRYIGSDLSDEESQMRDYRQPLRVLKVQKAENEDLEATGILEKEDLVYTCTESEYNRVNRREIGIEQATIFQDFKVEGLLVLPDQPKRLTSSLSDRRLSQEIAIAFENLMKAHSGVGMRTKSGSSSPGRRLLSRTTSNVTRGSSIFKNFGILIDTASTALKQEIENAISMNGGTVINCMLEIYKHQSEEPQVGNKGKQKVRFEWDQPELCPVFTHRHLNTILLVSDEPTRRPKYLMALALGIPCVLTRWVANSCDEGSALNWIPYMIGSGPSAHVDGFSVNGFQSLVHGRERHDLESIFEFQSKLQIFKNKKFLCLTSKGKAALESFEVVRPILCALGAQRIERLDVSEVEKIREKEFDYIITENNTKPPARSMIGTGIGMTESVEVQDLPKRRKLVKVPSVGSSSNLLRLGQSTKSTKPFVDFEWVIQCLIFGDVLKAQLWAADLSRTVSKTKNKTKAV